MASTLFSLPADVVVIGGFAAPGAKAYFYERGTTTPLAVYTTAAMDVPHANPVVANAVGRFPDIYYDSTNPPRLVLKDRLGVPIDGGDFDPLLPDTDLKPLSVKSFGAAGDGTTDDTTAIQAALDYLGDLGGGELYLPEGTYKVTTYLTVPAKTTVKGAGRRASVITCAHAGGGGANAHEDLRNGSVFVSTNPVDTPTRVNLRISHLGIRNTNAANVGAAFYDRDGTFIDLADVWIEGFKYGVVLDQSEIVTLDSCEIELHNAGGACLWLVNGPDLSAGASPIFTNEITAARCQLNPGASAYCVIDDGGQAHAFLHNNYNGGINALRLAGGTGVVLHGGGFESQSDHIVRMDSARLSGGGVGGSILAVEGGVYIPVGGKACFFGTAAGPGHLTVKGASLNGTGYAIQGAANFNRIVLGANQNNTGHADNLADGTAANAHFDADLFLGDTITPKGGTLTVAGNIVATGVNNRIGPQSGGAAITVFTIDNNDINSQLVFRSQGASNDATLTSTRGAGGGLTLDIPTGGYHRVQQNGGNLYFADTTGFDFAVPLRVTGTVTVSDEAYDATSWNGSTQVPTKNAVRDKIEDILDGVTFTGSIVVPADAYDATAWNGSNAVPTKDAVRDKLEGALTPASVAIGGGTALTKTVVYTPSLTPSSVNAATVAEQTFTVSGLTTADTVIVNPPAIANATGIAGARVSAADTLAIRFVNPTVGALTPTSGTYTIVALRS